MISAIDVGGDELPAPVAVVVEPVELLELADFNGMEPPQAASAPSITQQVPPNSVVLTIIIAFRFIGAPLMTDMIDLWAQFHVHSQ